MSINSTDLEAQVSMSRSTGLPPELGRATSELKCKLPDVVKDDFSRLARSLGLNDSELLRDMVMTRLYGPEKVAKMHARRLEMVSGIEPQTTDAQP